VFFSVAVPVAWLASWKRISSDYNVLAGGLLPFGMLVLLLSPLIAGKIRGTTR